MPQLSPDRLAQTDINAGWPLPALATIVSIQLAESGGNTNEVGWDNGKQGTVADTTGTGPIQPPGTPFTSYDVGISQVNSSHNPNAAANVYDPSFLTAMEDPTQNAKAALKVYQGAGNSFSPWTTYTKGANQPFVSLAQQAVTDINTGVSDPNASVPLSEAQGNPGSTNVAGQSDTNTTLTGLAGILQSGDSLLHISGPAAPGTLASLNPFGDVANTTENIVAGVETLLVRLGFAAAFLVITYLGIKQLTGTKSSAIEIVERQQGLSIARGNLAASEANRQARLQVEQQRTATATARANTSRTVNRNVRTEHTSIHRNPASEAREARLNANAVLRKQRSSK